MSRPPPSGFAPLDTHCPHLSRADRSLRLRPSREIRSSGINLGCECLDRDMWNRARAFPHLADTGAKWARIQTGWSRCEPADGQFTFGWLDEIVDELLAAGIQPWFNVGYGNQLHTAAPAPDAVGWAPVCSAEAARAWKRFLSALVPHFRDRIRHFEIWNEPDIPVFWKGSPPDPEKYAELVALSAPVIRALHPAARIVGGAIAHGGEPSCLEFLERAFRAGMGGHIDGLSLHAYRPRPEGARQAETRALRTLLARHRVNPFLWQGEAGCPSEMSRREAMAGIPWTETKQAKWLLRTMLTDLDLGFEMTSHFHLSDFHNYFNDGPGDRKAYFGLLRLADHSRKPAFAAFQSMANLFDGETTVDRELCVHPETGEAAPAGAARRDWMLTQALGFSRRGLPLVAYWYPAELNPEIDASPPFAPGRVKLAITRAPGLNLTDPVLVDPVTHAVHPVAGRRCGFGFTEPAHAGHQLVFEDLPLLDYPLLLTDAQALDLSTPAA